MKGRRKRKICIRSVSKKREDRISKLSDPLIASIISHLQTNEAVRTSVLSKHWKNMWRFTSCLNLDQKTISSGEIKRYVQSTELLKRIEKGQRRARLGRVGRGWDPIGVAARWIERVIDQHNGPLVSCRIQHMTESIWEVSKWMKKLLEEKKVRELYMERDILENQVDIEKICCLCTLVLEIPFEVLAGFHVVELNNYILNISSPPSFTFPQNLKSITLTHGMLMEDVGTFFSGCLTLENICLEHCKLKNPTKIHNPRLKILNLVHVNITDLEVYAMNLEVLVIDSVVRLPQGKAIVAPNMKIFHCRCSKMTKAGGIYLLSLRQILEDFCNVVTLEGSEYPSIYENLESLYINLNLRNEKDSVLLSKILKSCHTLQNLEIQNEVDEKLYALCDGETIVLDMPFPPNTWESIMGLFVHQTNKPNLPYPTNMLWRMMDFDKCIRENLKTAHIAGYKGKKLEEEFVKYLIAVCERIESITISFDDDCILRDATATMGLLSFPKSSPNLSITLEPRGKITKVQMVEN